jgi:hypothetical protein
MLDIILDSIGLLVLIGQAALFLASGEIQQADNGRRPD